MNNLSNNKIIKSAFSLMLLSAFLHMSILSIYFLKTFDTSPFNFFKIIGLDIFFPKFVQSPLGSYIASGVVVFLYVMIYSRVSKHKK